MLRIILLLYCLLFTTAAIGHAEDTDPYSLSLVGTALRLRQSNGTVVIAQQQKHLARLGDAVSIAALKLLSAQDLENPKIVRDLLPVIHAAFNEPGTIGLDDNKKPSVTLFLLVHLEEHIVDPDVRAELQQEIAFVRRQSDLALRRLPGGSDAQ